MCASARTCTTSGCATRSSARPTSGDGRSSTSRGSSSRRGAAHLMRSMVYAASPISSASSPGATCRDEAVIAHVLILWGVIAVAAALGVVVHRRRTPDEAPEYQSSLTFVGAAYGLLLGLLVVFAVGHYTDVRHEAQAEASTLVALQDTVRIYPSETSDPVRHAVVCYMRSIVHDEWPSMERGKDTAARRTLGFGDRVRADVRK